MSITERRILQSMKSEITGIPPGMLEFKWKDLHRSFNSGALANPFEGFADRADHTERETGFVQQ